LHQQPAKHQPLQQRRLRQLQQVKHQQLQLMAQICLQLQVLHKRKPLLWLQAQLRPR
jgi:hypothetical protein